MRNKLDREANLANSTIANLEEKVDVHLCPQTKRNSREEEARIDFHEAVDSESKPKNLVQIIEECVAPLGGVELESRLVNLRIPV